MAHADTFTLRRLTRFVDGFRARTGQLPTLKDFSGEGFESETVELAIKEKYIERFYVTLTNGTVVKGFKVCRDDSLV